MNIAITNVSFITMRDNALVIRDYVDKDGNKFKGCMTNEAPLKSLMCRMQARGERLDRIIFIESAGVRREREIPYGGVKKSMATGDFLRHLIREYAEAEDIVPPDFDCAKDVIAIEDEPGKKAVAETVFAVYGRLLELYHHRVENENMNIFIESNGGVRYVLTMLLSIAKTLENSLEHFNIEEISSMVLRENPVNIIDTRDIYDTSQITSIIEEYVNYGRVSSMEKYIQSLFKHYPDGPLRRDAEALVQKLVSLAEDIQLCRTRWMLDDFYEDGGIGAAIDRFIEKYRSCPDAEADIFIFIMRRIKKEFDVCIYDGYEPGVDSILFLPKVIEWCLQKDFMQQALTLCSERIPEYLFRSGKIALSEDFDNLLNHAKIGKYERAYYFVANLSQEFLRYLDDVKVNEIMMRACQYGQLLPADQRSDTLRKTEVQASFTDYSEFNRMAQSVYDVAKAVRIKLPDQITEGCLRTIFTAHGLKADDVGKIIKISNKGKSTILGMLQGKSFKKDNQESGANPDLKEGKARESEANANPKPGKVRELEPNPNLRPGKVRLMKLLPELAELYLDQVSDEETYKRFIAETFAAEAPAFVQALEERYARVQSGKFYIADALKTGHIRTCISDNDAAGQAQLQKILYLFSLCKEQRNLSNHAHVSEDDVSVAMNTGQLKILIGKLLEALYIG